MTTARSFVVTAVGVLLAANAAAQGVPRLDSYDGVAVRILQSNNAGNVHHLIDPTTRRVVGLIRGCPHAHNLAVHPDSLYYYCSNEQDKTVDVFDTRTLQQLQQIPLSERPNKVVVNKKYRKMYAGIRQVPRSGGAVIDVIDVDTNTRVKSISVHHGVHNTYVTPDERWVIAGLGGEVKPGEPTIQVIDPATDTVAWSMELTGYEQYGRTHHEVRPMAFEANADGSTKRMFAQATGINAVWVIDWASRKVVDMLWPPKLPAWKQNADGIQTGDMHGLEVLPNRSAVWASSRLDSRIYGWSLPDLKYIGAVEVGPTANWMTPTPDSRFMYVAVSGADYTAVVDLQKLQIVDKIKVGARPARINTAILPLNRVNAPAGTNGASAAPRTPTAVNTTAGQTATPATSRAAAAADVDFFRTNIEPLFMRARGGTMPGYASCVMCHTWQTKLRLTLQTPATDAGWTAAQSRANFDVVTSMINTSNPESSRLLLKPLAPNAGGLGHTGGIYWSSRQDPEYQAVLAWIRSLPDDRYVPPAEPMLDFAFFNACVQQVFAKPRDGHIRCSNCHNAGIIGFAPPPSDGRDTWTDAEAKRAFQLISRLIVPGDPDHSRFLLKPLHPDAGGSYAHNGVRRWQSRSDPEYRMLAEWIAGKRTGSTCS
jgi:DNA-binding beta-propeller fold protein YncE